MNAEKHLTRYAVDQTRRNGEVLHALRTDVSAATMRLDSLAGDMAAVKSALAMHGRALDVLMQDVRQLRSEVTELRSEVALSVTELRSEVTETRSEVTQLRSGQEAINARLGMIERNVAAILAAVAPGSPPPA